MRPLIEVGKLYIAIPPLFKLQSGKKIEYAYFIEEKDEIMVVSANGVVTRVSAADISRQGRPATGVRVQTLDGNDSVVSVNKIIDTDKEDDNTELVEEAKKELQEVVVEQKNIFEEE